ncbi:hypothetical protein H0H92_014837 [Tricholoma furcatifolium]|nr:hypothetical protein H0H92_014837 [Tricholoma furcatifolium]
MASTLPALWIAPLDVECLKWQAYLALRGIEIHLRTDIDPQGAVDGHLPNLQTNKTTVLPAHLIPQWADQQASALPENDYVSQDARDESQAWIALLEGPVHAALIAAAPTPSYLASLVAFHPPPAASLPTLLTQPPPPLSGIASIVPPFGTQISYDDIFAHYSDAMSALSLRLATDKWLLASQDPTPLDALLFAYLHAISVSSNNTLRLQFSRHVNLVSWERRVRDKVRPAFTQP